MTREGVTTGVPLQVAGQSLIEYQARTLAACGARHIVVMVQTLPAYLVTAFDRLRSEGFSIDTARTAQDAADRIHPDETVLVFAPGLVASTQIVTDLAALPAPALATCPEEPGTAKFERIDRTDRWGGIATISGLQLRETSAQLGEWDLAATLLRVSLQNGATRVRVPATAYLGIVDSQADAADASSRLAGAAAAAGQSPFARWIAAPLASFGLAHAVRSTISFDLLSVLPATVLLAAVLLATIGWPIAALILFAAAAVGHAVASGMAACALRNTWPIERYPWLALGAFVALMIFAGVTWSGIGWGVHVLTAWIIANAVLRSGVIEAWAPDLPDLAILLALAAAIGFPAAGLALAIGWQLLPVAINRAKPLF